MKNNEVEVLRNNSDNILNKNTERYGFRSNHITSVTSSFSNMRIRNDYSRGNNYSNSYQPKKKKWRWHDGHGNQLTAGGILPYDDNGIWALGEKSKIGGPVIYTDFGGKYEFEDGDILACITRELQEETYYSVEVTRSQLMRAINGVRGVYINGHHGHPVYICYPIHVSKLFEVTRYNDLPFILNEDRFRTYRDYVLRGNPHVPKCWYKQVEMKHIPFSKLDHIQSSLSYRLKQILRYHRFNNVPKIDNKPELVIEKILKREPNQKDKTISDGEESIPKVDIPHKL